QAPSRMGGKLNVFLNAGDDSYVTGVGAVHTVRCHIQPAVRRNGLSANKSQPGGGLIPGACVALNTVFGDGWSCAHSPLFPTEFQEWRRREAAPRCPPAVDD